MAENLQTSLMFAKITSNTDNWTTEESEHTLPVIYS